MRGITVRNKKGAELSPALAGIAGMSVEKGRSGFMTDLEALLQMAADHLGTESRPFKDV